MDFGVLGLEGLSGLENGAPSQLSIYPETMPKAVGSSSRFVKKERSEPDEGDKPVSKMPKTVDFSATKTLTLHQPTPLLRSNSLVSPDNNNTRNQHHEQMLSFSSYKSQVPFLTTSTALMERSSQQATSFPFYQHLPSSAHTRNTGMCFIGPNFILFYLLGLFFEVSFCFFIFFYFFWGGGVVRMCL